MQPDIDYHPDEAKYLARTARLLAENPDRVNTPLPEGFPKHVEGPIVWEGKDWPSEDQWVYELSPAELEEIDSALKHFKTLNLPWGHIAKDTFPLPTLSSALADLANELHSGRGFFVLRTLPIDDYSRTDIVLIFAGISSHIGPVRGQQDSLGNVLAHVKDLTSSHAHEKGGIGSTTYTTDKQVFHTDIGDLVVLLALQVAAEGGMSKLSSGWRIYNELAATRPDIIATLSKPWPIDTHGGNPGYKMRPLLFCEDGRPVIQYTRRHFTGFDAHKRSPNIPPITEAQAEALDALHFLAEKFSLGFHFQKGDIQYINSIGLLHAREAFKDDAEHTRHLVRLWLRNDELAWKTPGLLRPAWQKIFSVEPDKQRFPLEPEIRRNEYGGTK